MRKILSLPAVPVQSRVSASVQGRFTAGKLRGSPAKRFHSSSPSIVPAKIAHSDLNTGLNIISAADMF